MINTTYSGWTNYPTWRVNLEITADYCDSLRGDQTFSDLEELADHLKDYVEEVISDGANDSIAHDYALAFVSDVNWYEIAESNPELIESDDNDAEGDN